MTYNFCSALGRHDNVDFALLVPAETPEYPDLPFASKVHRVLPKWRGSVGRSPSTIFRLLFPRTSPPMHLVHALVEFPYAIVANRLARRGGVPYVVSGQGTYSVAPLTRVSDRWLYLPALRGAATITVPSSYTAASMRSAARAELRIEVLHNAVDAASFEDPGDARILRKRLELPDDCRILLSVGAIKRRKGFDLLIQAFARIASSEPNLHLLIAGEGSDSDLVQLANTLGVASRTHFLGQVKQDDLVSLYHACEVFALLPRNESWHFEGFGLVFLEAGACGKPVVASRSGGVSDAVRGNETGLLVDENDPSSAANAIVRLLTDAALARRLGSAGKDWAQSHSWERYVGRMLDVYQEALDPK